MARDPLPLDQLGEIPDPAAGVARRPAPPSPAPPAEPSPTRDARRRLARAALLLALAWLSVAFAIFGARQDVASPSVIAPLAAWTIAGGLGLFLVMRPGARGLPVDVRVVEHALWIVPAVYLVGVVLLAAPGPEVPLSWATARSCLGLANLMALGPLIGAAMFLRRSFTSAPELRGGAVGALAGLWGTIGVHAHCPVQATSHLVVAHGASIAVGAAVGAALGRLLGRP
jgi:hypothetical protein